MNLGQGNFVFQAQKGIYFVSEKNNLILLGKNIIVSHPGNLDEEEVSESV